VDPRDVLVLRGKLKPGEPGAADDEVVVLVEDELASLVRAGDHPENDAHQCSSSGHGFPDANG
jgi:hypothetical protein